MFAIRRFSTAALKKQSSCLARIIAAHDLNEAPFYKAWSKGTLKTDDMVTYAGEYQHFISSIPQGWSTLGDDAHANEEVEHAELWSKFANSIGSGEGKKVDEMLQLVAQAKEDFRDPVKAVGALYAFEAQQPSTSVSKLEGLKTHYRQLSAESEYFVVHASDYGEANMLEDRFDALTPEEQVVAAEAAEKTAKALLKALDGVYTGEDCMA